MCQTIDKIDLKRSIGASRGKAWLRFFTKRKAHGKTTVWTCKRQGLAAGQVCYGVSGFRWLDVSQWPLQLREIVHLGFGQRVKRTKPKPGKAETAKREADKITAALANWQRKLKLAQTKIRKLKKRLRYYERRQAEHQQAPPAWTLTTDLLNA